jgi:1-deoxy-D-xylulose-5-phosphate synthase
MRYVKPLDEALVLQLAGRHRAMITIEENALAGGAGSAINELLVSRGLTVPVLNLGLPDRYLAHGTREQVLADAGLDAPSIRRAIETRRARH